MLKRSIWAWLWLLLCASSLAQDTNFLNMASPKLREFLSENPSSLKLLTNTFTEAFTNRTMQLYYFYSDNENQARASHYYPSDSVVGILIRENQLPFDEFISLLFEVINSEGEARFLELAHKAESRAISKEDFVQEMLKTEYAAMKKTRDLLKSIAFNKKDKSKSYYYKQFIECPDQFKDFLAYVTPVSLSLSGPTRHLEEQYDMLQINSPRQP